MRIPLLLAFVFVAARGFADAPASLPTTRPASTRPALHTLTTASPITLHFDAAPARTVFNEIARQAGFEFEVHPADFWEARRTQLKPITLDCIAQPFWAVMKEACHQSGANFRAVRPGSGMTLGRGRGSPLESPGVLAGPCLIVPEELHVSARIPQDRPESASGELGMSFSVYAEPRARLLLATLRVREALDDRGASMLADDDAPQPTLTKWSEAAWRGEVPLKYQPFRHDARLARFKADLHLFLQSAVERVEWPFPFGPGLVNHAFTVGGRRFRVNSGDGWAQPSLSITAFKDAMSAEEWSWYGKAPWRCELIDAADHPVTRQRGVRETGPDSVTFREYYNCERPMPPGAAAKFAWEIPTALKEIVVPLEFTDWMLP